MARDCNTCRYFRDERRLTELLRLTNSIDVQPTIDQMYQREQDLVGQEYARKQKLINARQEEWSNPPHVVSYCALREDQHVWLVHEVKNEHYKCRDYAEVEGAQPCSTCIHNVVPRGAAEDGQILLDTISPANNWYSSWGISDNQHRDYSTEIKSNVDKVMRVSSSQQGIEMQQAFHGRGVLPHPPRYYPYCAKYSTPGAGRYVLSRCRNPDHRCPSWSATGYDAPEPASSDERPSVSDPSGPPDHGDGVHPLLKLGVQILKEFQRRRGE
jgi:hypothetical protein